MTVLTGLYAPDLAAPEARARWAALTAGLGAPSVEAEAGPLRAALFPQHAGDLARCPGAASTGPPGGFPIGFGGDGAGTPPADLAPPWLVCAWDAARRAAVIETDRHGFAVVYVRAIGTTVAFSTRATALGRIPPRPDPDPSAMAEMLAFDHLLAERTLRAGVAAVPQGCALEIDAAGARFPRRFRYADVPLDRGARARDAAATLMPLWRRAIAGALRGRGDAPVLIPLSGGLDSRLLAASAAELGAGVETFTFARAGEDAPDVAIARSVARALGLPWRALPLEDDWLAIHARRTAALTDGQLDVLHAHGVSLIDTFSAGRLRLDGLAGDVVLGGSFLRPELAAVRGAEQRAEHLWRLRGRLRRPDWLELLLPEARDEMVRRARASLLESLEDAPPDDPRWSDFWVLRHRIRRFTVNGALLWNSVARSVFTFFAPGWIDRLLAVPPRTRRDGALQAHFFWQGFPRMAAIPWQRTGRPVPRGGLWDAIARRILPPAQPPGRTFFDAGAAFRASPRLRGFLRDLLLDPGAGVARHGCFDRAAVARILDDSAAGARSGMPQLGALATLVLAEELV